MTIRKATYIETQKILNHSMTVMGEATMGFVTPKEEKALEMLSPFLSNGGYYLVYIKNNMIMGWIACGSMMDIYSNKAVGFIPEIYVLPPYRKQGIAEKLCKESFKYLKEEGYRKVQLNVFAGNKAKQLYQRLGFSDVSTLMEKPLDK